MKTAKGDRPHIFTGVKPLKTFYILPQWRELFQGFYTLKIEWWYSWGAMVVYSCSGESTPLPPMWPGCNSQVWCHMWVEFVVGSLPCSKRFFSGYSSFPLSSKTNISKFQFDQESGRWRTTMWMCYLQIVIYFICFFLYFEVYTISEYNEQWVALLSMHPLNISRTDTGFGYFSGLW